MLYILRKFIDCLLPPHPTTLIIRAETPEKFLRYFKPKTFQGTIALSEYKEEIVKNAIKANKFHNDNQAAILLAKLIEKWLEEQIVKPTILVPIPLAKTREQNRGYNQVTRILEKIANHENVLVENLLIRTRETPPQTKLSRSERLTNLKNVFAFRETRINLQSYRIVLIDDVVTTGTTLNSAYEVLKEKLPNNEIIRLALAH